MLGSGTVALTYTNSTGGTDQITVEVPWSLEFKVKRGTFLYLSAQKQQRAGVIEATLSIDGIAIKTAKADSEYGVASVTGSIK